MSEPQNYWGSTKGRLAMTEQQAARPEPRTESGKRDHDLAWQTNGGGSPVSHDSGREDCAGCVFIARIEAEAARPVEGGLREAVQFAVNHLSVSEDVAALEILRAALAKTPEAAPRSDEGLDPLDEFVETAAAKMRERLDHGARKFGALSWREDGYADIDNEQRLKRAVQHLVVAVRNGTGSGEYAKRAADVANQAFMYADPARLRENDDA